jgi:hypothetical protein
MLPSAATRSVGESTWMPPAATTSEVLQIAKY